MTDLEWLSEWFEQQCDGDWEHEFGVTIGTLDNPGWSLRVDLVGTPLRDALFTSLALDDGEQWMRLWKDDDPTVFHGACSPMMLSTMLARFRGWASTAA